MEKLSTKIYNSPDGEVINLDYETIHPLIKENLDVLFIGINPHPSSIEKDGYFVNNGSLWNQLSEVGITSERIDCRKLLNLNMGITNIVLRPTVSSSEVSKQDLIIGKKRLLKEIEFSSPKAICFIGKTPYLGLIEGKTCEYGWQKESIRDAKCFVMMFPTFRCSKEKKLEILKQLSEGCKGIGIDLPKKL